MLSVTVLLISASLFLPFFPLICHTHCEEANPCSSEICEYTVRNVCPSWHYNALYQLTRGVGGEWRGREEDVKMFGNRKKKESSLWPLIWQDMKQLNGFGIWQNSFLQWAFTTRGIPWHEATYVWAAEREGGREREKREREFPEEKRQPEGVLEVPYFVNCPR